MIFYEISYVRSPSGSFVTKESMLGALLAVVSFWGGEQVRVAGRAHLRAQSILEKVPLD